MIFSYEIRNGAVLESRTGGVSRSYNNNNNTHTCTHTSESADVKYIRTNAGASDMGTINSSDRIV
jgi:hypothetical protein